MAVTVKGRVRLTSVFGRGDSTHMTHESAVFAMFVLRLMRGFGKVFRVFWLFICGAMAVMALCALLGVPQGVRVEGTPASWAAVLLASLVFAGVGVLFLRFWLRTLDKFAAHFPEAPAPNPRHDPHETADVRGQTRLSTTAHLGWQMGLTVMGCLLGLVMSFVFVRNAGASQLVSGLVFLLVMGVAMGVPRLVMRWIPARCPKCSGEAYCRGSRPITFVCRDCHQTHNTGMSMGDGD